MATARIERTRRSASRLVSSSTWRRTFARAWRASSSSSLRRIAFAWAELRPLTRSSSRCSSWRRAAISSRSFSSAASRALRRCSRVSSSATAADGLGGAAAGALGRGASIGAGAEEPWPAGAVAVRVRVSSAAAATRPTASTTAAIRISIPLPLLTGDRPEGRARYPVFTERRTGRRVSTSPTAAGWERHPFRKRRRKSPGVREAGAQRPDRGGSGSSIADAVGSEALRLLRFSVPSRAWSFAEPDRSSAAAPQPVADLLADRLHGVAGVAHDRREALGVEVDGVAGLGARGLLLAAARVLARDDAAVLAAVDPVHDLAAAAHGERVSGADLQPEALDAVQALLGLVEVLGLLEERVEVQPLGGNPGGERHQRAAGHERVAIDQRRRAVGRQLAGARPLHERVAQPEQRQAGQERDAGDARHPDQDRQRRAVEDVVGEDVADLVGEDGLQLLGVEQAQ